MVVDKPQRRGSPRLRCTGEALIYLSMEEAPEVAKIADLSLSGCRLVTMSPCELERNACVELAFFVNGLPFRVRARLRAPRSPTEFGFAFLELSARLRRGLQELTEELMEGEEGRNHEN